MNLAVVATKRSRLRVVAMTLVVIGSLSAQTEPAGGKWTYRFVADPMRDGYGHHEFTLLADKAIADGPLSGTPVLLITCGKQWSGTRIDVPVIIDSEQVEMTVDGKRSGIGGLHSWGVSEDRKSFFIDDSSPIALGPHGPKNTKEMLQGSDVRIKFSAYPGHSFVIRFSPAGINSEMLTKACGAKLAEVKRK